MRRLAVLVPALAALAGMIGAAESDGQAIIVTGESIDHDEQKTLTSVKVVTAGDLQDRPAPGHLDDVLRDTANVAVVDGIFSIRGVNNVAVGSAPLIGVTVDDAWVSPNQFRWSRTAPPLWDVEQVEVLRGPQSTERGASSLGGAVVVKTIDPTWYQEGQARVTYGEYNSYQVAAAHGGPLIDDVLAFRVAVNGQGTDGYLEDPAGRDDYGRNREVDGRLKLLWQPLRDDRLQIKLTMSGLKGITNNQNANALSADPEDRRPDPGLEGLPNIDQEVNNHSFALDARWRVNEAWSLVSTTTTTYFDTYADYAVLEPLDYFRYHDTDVTQELRLRHTGHQVESSVGLWFARYHDDYDTIQGSGALTLNSAERRGDTAVFAAADWHLTERFTVAGGLRLEHENYSIDYYRNAAGGGDDQQSSVVLPRVGASYDLTSRVTLGAQVSRGYRGGGSSYNANQGAFRSYDPEFATNYELSLRTRLVEGWTCNLNAFHTDWKDKQVSIYQGPSLGSFIENAGSATLQGVELETRLQPAVVTGLSATGSLGWQRATYDDYNTGTVDYSGNRIEYVPQWTAAMEVAYRHASGVFGSTAIRYIGKAYDSAANNDQRTIFGATTIDGKLGYAFSHTEVYAFGSNLTDRYYELRNQSAYYVQPAAPRVLGVGVDAHW